MADSSNTVDWAAVVAFIKQIVGAFNVSPDGTHFAFVTYADRSGTAFSFPLGALTAAQYNVQVVRRYVDAATRSRGVGRNINVALQDVVRLLTRKDLGSRTNARKVMHLPFSDGVSKSCT